MVSCSSMVGETVGDYQVLRQMGEGPMSLVYRARDLKLDRDVALKMLRPEFAAEMAGPMRAAVTAQARLDHPNIAKVYGWFQAGDRVFIASEWVAGLSLEELVRLRPISGSQAEYWLGMMADAIQSAHRLGVVHGDLKPTNVLLDSPHAIKITDFAMAGAIGRRRATSLLNPAYVSPEQALGKDPDPRSDQYALACVFYFMLAGRPPFTGETDYQVLSSHVSAPPPPIGAVAPGVSPAVEAAILRAMAKDPQDRFPDVVEFVKALHAEPVKASSAGDRAPAPADENVAFTVFRPRSVAPAAWETMLVFAHLTERPADSPSEPEPIEEVRRQARQILGERAAQFQDLTQDSTLPIAREGQLTFVPEMAGVDFNPPNAAVVWQEHVHRVEFRLRAQAQLDGTTARGRLTVFLGRLVVAQIPLSIRVAREAKPAARENWEPVTTPVYRKIFASYSHKDAAVVEEFESYAAAMGDRYLRDVIQLRAGEAWRNSLLAMIQQADVFQLFWSSNSIESPFVEEEWRYALSLKRESFVRPVYWQEPLPELPDRGLPPDELRSLHFQRVAPGFARSSHTPVTRSGAYTFSGAPVEARAEARQPITGSYSPPFSSPTSVPPPMSAPAPMPAPPKSPAPRIPIFVWLLIAAALLALLLLFRSHSPS